MNCAINENMEVSLHDCHTNKVDLDLESITFYIPDGFYIIKDSSFKSNNNAKVKCHFLDNFDNFNVYIYEQNILKKTIRKDYTNEFISKINKGEFEFEFVTTYRAYQYILFKGYIWQDKKPYHKECEIEIHTDEITYSCKEDV